MRLSSNLRPTLEPNLVRRGGRSGAASGNGKDTCTARSLGLCLCLVLPTAAAASGADACMARAAAQIRRAPDRTEFSYTTSHVFKRQLAEHFCELGAGMTVLELGVHHGHTTAVLGAIFQRVIAVDVLRQSLDIAASHTRELSNVFMLSFDLMSSDWQAFASNNVSVVVIDANHDYENVLSDARNSLRYFPSLQHLVFDDYIFDSVHQAVQELEDGGLLVDCQGIGTGWDGSAWSPRFNRSEGRICRAAKGPQLAPLRNFVQRSFLNLRFYVYRMPLDMRHAGYMRFFPDGSLLSSQWRRGNWSLLQDDGLLLRLPRLSRRHPLLLQFNYRRLGFLICKPLTLTAEWFGIQEDVLTEPFKQANADFG